MLKSAAKRVFRIQYVSDLHLEFYEKATFPLLVKPCARHLVLAGDIGKPGHPVYDSFLRYVSTNWERVFYVAGNHEYYEKERKRWTSSAPTPFQTRHQELLEVTEKYPNVHYLHHDRPSFYLPKENVVFVGSTLWSHIPRDKLTEAGVYMNDYNYIPFVDSKSKELRCLTPMDTNMFHLLERQRLDAQIRYWQYRGARVCVVSHHMPSTDLVSPRYKDHPLTCCFASSCEDLMHPAVKVWIYGHTHNSSSGVIKNTLCVCNARGYPNESVPGFRPDTWVDIPIDGANEEGRGADSDLAASAAGIQNPVLSAKTTRMDSDSDIEFV